jgi:RHS repeat-associated protein
VYPSGTASSLLPSNYAPGVKVNYVRSTVPTVAVLNEGDVHPLIADETRVSTNYYDGLGRQIQTVSHFGSPSRSDVVDVLKYDNFGRDAWHFLPYTKAESTETDNGKFKLTAFSDQKDFYKTALGYSADNYFYSQNNYEPSPLNRVIKTLPQGNSWVGNNRGTSISENPLASGVVIPNYTIAYTPGSLPVFLANYGTGELMVKITTDEDGYFVEEYKDKQNHVVAKATGKTGNSKLFTYYVYDDFGLLRFVFPPKAVKLLTSANQFTLDATTAKELCFSYEYDARLRPFVKGTPGGGSEYYVYNLKNELVFSQTPGQRAKGEWIFNKYDVLGRLIQTGVYNNTISQSGLQTQVNSGNAGPDDFLIYLFKDVYGNSAYQSSFSSAKVQSTNYYDDYSFTSRTYNTTYMGSLQTGWNTTVSKETTNLLTGTKVLVLDGSATPTELLTVNFYNDRGLLLQSQTQNHKGGWNTITNSYDFLGQKQGTYTDINNPQASNNANIKTVESFYYDHAGRLLADFQSLNGGAATPVIANGFDELGRLDNKNFSNGVDPTIKYEYNVRNWLTGINRQYCLYGSTGQTFGMELSYDYGYAYKYYNGNISGMKWRNSGTPVPLRSYGYRYDAYNRLQSGDFIYKRFQIDYPSAWETTVEDFTASNMTYDENGNMLSLKQLGKNTAGQKIVLDDLTYTYNPNSNKLRTVSESSSSQSKDPTIYDNLGDFRDRVNSADYYYDAGNGNLTNDLNKNLTFTYDEIINKTKRVTNGTQNVDYLYDAKGNKLQKKVSPGTVTTTDYIGTAVYINNSLSFISHPEGRIRYSASSPTPYMYDYFIKDHLGSTRSVITVTDGAITGFAKSEAAPSNEVVYLATSEPENAAKENQLFDNIENSRSANPNKKVQNDNYVAKIYSKGNKTVLGPDITLRVMAGDKVKISAEALYIAEKGSVKEVVDNALNSFVTAFTTPAVLAAEGVSTIANNGMKNLATSVLNLQNQKTQDGGPKAFLNYILYDDQMNLITEGSGAIQVEEKEGWQTLETEQMEIPQNGFLRVFSNNQEAAPVSMNNTMLAVIPGKLVEEYNYYPYGLVFGASSASSTIKKTDYLYNGKELQHNEFGQGNGLELEDYGARLYDPQIGRWHQVDPLSYKYLSFSPYNYCIANPTNSIDYDGRDIIVLNAPKGAGGLGHGAVLIGNDKTGWLFYSKNGTYSHFSSGPSKNREVGLPFTSLNDFKERYLNSASNIDKKTGEIYYTNGFRITTTPDKDEQMQVKAEEQTLKFYDATSTISGNCMDVCRDAMSKVGLDPGINREKSKVGGSRALLIANTIKKLTPNEIYKNIKKNNKGEDISKSLIPDKKPVQ